MSVIRLWLNVYETWCPSGKNELWTKEITVDFPPREGDLLYLSYDPDEQQDACAWYVKRHYWNFNGSYEIELRDMVIDPVAMTNIANEYTSPWYTDAQYGRPEPVLRRGGWITYEELQDLSAEKQTPRFEPEPMHRALWP